MFETLDALPPDPILGLSIAYRKDTHTDKIDMGVGVYKDHTGKTPIMKAILEAERIFLAQEGTKSYTPPAGFPGFIDGIIKELFGAGHMATAAGRVNGVQAPGGCGALRLAGELLVRRGSKKLWVGTPTWANHMPLLSAAGLTVETTPYYDKNETTLLFDAFAAHLRTLGPEDIVLFHGACHNPTGSDFSPAQWIEIAEIVVERGFLPFVDTAYHGFAKGLEEDAVAVRLLAETVPEMLISYSCSKNFGLYRERTGGLLVMGKTADNAIAVKSHMENIARAMYSMPPAHGGALVTTILQSQELASMWREELNAMREDVIGKRQLLVRAARNNGLDNSLSYIANQNGMFSLLPITPDQVGVLREEHSIYMTNGGRINMCGISETNVDKFCKAYRSVL